MRLPFRFLLPTLLLAGSLLRATDEAPAAPAGLLARIPAAVMGEICSYVVKESHGVSRAFESAALAGARELTVTGPVDDAGLLTYLRSRPRLRRLAIRHASHLTPPGLLAALQACPALESLELTPAPTGMNGTMLLPLAATHARLTRLRLDCPVGDDLLRAFGDQLEELILEQAGALTPSGLGSLTRLRSLFLADCASLRDGGLPATLERALLFNCEAFTGADLPAALRRLEVVQSPVFTGTGLPQGLTDLAVTRCRGFLGVDLPPALRSLEVTACAAFSARALPAGLDTLAVRSVDFTGEGLPPGLRRLRVEFCDAFQDVVLPASLRSLDVDVAPRFTGWRVPGTLESLTIANCPYFEEAQLRARLPTLVIIDPGTLHVRAAP